MYNLTFEIPKHIYTHTPLLSLHCLHPCEVGYGVVVHYNYELYKYNG